MEKKLWKFVLPLLVGAGIWLLPMPHGLQPNAWHYFAIFSAVVVALILEPIPSAVAGLIGVTLAGVLLLVQPNPADSMKWALSGFSNAIVWLIFVAFMFGKAYEKTGLGRRISLVLVKALGKKTLGLGYAVAIADLIVAPFTPSSTARSGGIIFPIIRNIPPIYGSQPGETARQIGSYIMWTAPAATCINSSLFLTAHAPNLLAIAIAAKISGLSISWAGWFIGMLPAGLFLFAATPYLIYKIYPPRIKDSEEVPAWAARELSKMGGITRREVIMVLLVVAALALWILANVLKINETMTGLIILCAMLLSGVLTWDDVIGNKQAWSVLVWFATLVALADGLSIVKFLDWFARLASGSIKELPVTLMIFLLILIFYAAHYMFASVTAHTVALMPVFLAAAIAVPGMPVKLFTMMLCYSLGIMGILTPYGTGASPLYYGSGYLPGTDYWRLGLIFGAIYLAALFFIGYPWLRWILT